MVNRFWEAAAVPMFAETREDARECWSFDVPKA